MADNITALTEANRNTGAHIICCLCELWTTNLKHLSQYIATETTPLFQLPWFWKHFKTNFKHPKTWVKPKTVLYFNIPNTNMWKKNSALTIPVVFMCWSILGSWTMTCCWWAEKRHTNSLLLNIYWILFNFYEHVHVQIGPHPAVLKAGGFAVVGFVLASAELVGLAAVELAEPAAPPYENHPPPWTASAYSPTAAQ